MSGRKRISKHRQRQIEAMSSDSISKHEIEALGADIVVLPRYRDAIWTHHAKGRFEERKPQEGKRMIKRYAANVVTTVYYASPTKKKQYDRKKVHAEIEEEKRFKRKHGKGKNKNKF